MNPQDLIKLYKDNDYSYSAVAKEKGVTRQHIQQQFNRWRSLGWDIPHPARRLRDPICQVKECNEPHYAKEMCRTHYARYQRHGNPLAKFQFVNPNIDWRKDNDPRKHI